MRDVFPGRTADFARARRFRLQTLEPTRLQPERRSGTDEAGSVNRRGLAEPAAPDPTRLTHTRRARRPSLLLRPGVAQDNRKRGQPARRKREGARGMGFIGSNSTHELEAQADLEQFPEPIDEVDYEIEIDYTLDASEPEPDSESEYLEALQQSNNTADLFDWFFREQARRAFFDRGN